MDVLSFIHSRGQHGVFVIVFTMWEGEGFICVTIQWNKVVVIMLDNDLRQVGCVLWLLWFPPPIKLTATSGVKHHTPNPRSNSTKRISAVCLSLVYTCIAVGDPVIKKGWGTISLTSLTPPHCCACPKPGPGFATSYVVDCFVLS